MFAFDIIRKFFNKNDEKKQDLSKEEISTKREVPVMDASEPAARARQELLENRDKFLTYDDILRINENDRYTLLKDIYDNWGIHGIPEFFKEKYSKYDKNLIEQIYVRENNRLNMRIKAYHYLNMQSKDIWLTIFGVLRTCTGGTGIEYNWCICQGRDFLELNLTNKLECFLDNNKYWGMDIISNSLGVIMKDFNYNNDVNLNDIRLYHNGELHIFSKKEFLKYKEKYNLNNLYLTKQERDKVRHQELLEIKNIQPGSN